MSQVELQPKDIKINLSDSTSIIRNLLLNNDNINNLINNRLKIKLDEKTNQIVLNVFNTILGKTNQDSPLKSIINGIKECFADGKIDANDIPTIVKVVTDVLNLNKKQISQFKPNLEHIGVIIKVIITVLCDLNIISKGDNDNIMKIIDSSLALLSTSIDLSNVNCKKFFCCCK